MPSLTRRIIPGRSRPRAASAPLFLNYRGGRLSTRSVDRLVRRYVAACGAKFGISAFPPVTAAWKNANIKDDPHTQSNAAGTIVFAFTTSNAATRTIALTVDADIKLGGVSLDARLNVDIGGGQLKGVTFLLGVNF